MEDTLFNGLWEAAKTAGPFGTLIGLFMWFMERQTRLQERAERVKLQEERNALTERVITGLHTAASAVVENSKVIAFLGGQQK